MKKREYFTENLEVEFAVLIVFDIVTVTILIND